MANRVVLDNAAIATVLNGPNGGATRAAASVANRVRNEAVVRCPVDKGGLRSSIIMFAVRTGNVVSWMVGSRKNYARPVHEGSAPHVIERRGPLRNERGRIRTLKFPGRSGFVFVRRVNHPGNRAQPFLRDALRAVLKGT